MIVSMICKFYNKYEFYFINFCFSLTKDLALDTLILSEFKRSDKIKVMIVKKQQNRMI